MDIPKLSLNPDELKYYSHIFSIADVEKRGRIEGRPAVEFLKQSGLSLNLLRQIWSLTTADEESFLDMNRFFTALKLIALAEQGIEPKMDLLTTRTNLPLFQGIEMPKIDPFEIAPNEEQYYKQAFKSIGGGSEIVEAEKVMEMLKETQMPIEIAEKIMRLVNKGGSSLKEGSFIVLMHLTSRVLGYKIMPPDEVPQSLKKYIEINIENSPVNVVKSRTIESIEKPKEKDIRGKNVKKLPDDEKRNVENIIVKERIKRKESGEFIMKEVINFIREIIDKEKEETLLINEKNRELEENIQENKVQFDEVIEEFSELARKFKDEKKANSEIESLKTQIVGLQNSLEISNEKKEELKNIETDLNKQIVQQKTKYKSKIMKLKSEINDLKKTIHPNKEAEKETLEIKEETGMNAFHFPSPIQSVEPAFKFASNSENFFNFNSEFSFDPKEEPEISTMSLSKETVEIEKKEPKPLKKEKIPSSIEQKHEKVFENPKPEVNLFGNFGPPVFIQQGDPFDGIIESSSRKKSSSSSSHSNKPQFTFNFENESFDFEGFNFNEGSISSNFSSDFFNVSSSIQQKKREDELDFEETLNIEKEDALLKTLIENSTQKLS